MNKIQISNKSLNTISTVTVANVIKIRTTIINKYATETPSRLAKASLRPTRTARLGLNSLKKITTSTR